ncbi:MAG: Gfo/Idh/MocA family oxidoreductase [bacterium]|nr:Gfo/Idh/MocA family oxidoreductase [bacterium]
MTDPVRVVLIGNSFASKAQLPALRWAGGNEVIGIAGSDVEKARRTAEEWSIPHATGDWRELLELSPDLLVITTPVDLHAPMVRAALETDAALLCEKPFTLDAQEAVELTEATRGRLALLDHQLRWSPARRRLRALVQDGTLGEIWSGRAQMHFGSRARIDAPYSWWYDAARGGGALGAIVSHMLDALQNDLGPVEAVRARLATYRKTRPDADGVAREVTADEHATVWLKMASGAELELDTNLMAPGGQGSIVEYIGSEGTARLEGEERLIAGAHDEPMAEVDADPIPTPEELSMPDLGIFSRMLPLYLRDVIGAVAAGATSLAGAATFADGLETMRVLDAARRSASEGSWAIV